MAKERKWASECQIEGVEIVAEAFNNEQVTRNLYQFMDGKEKEYLPHGVTLNEFLERVNPAELEEIQRDIAYQMIRRKTFDDAKILGKWRILVSTDLELLMRCMDNRQ